MGMKIIQLYDVIQYIIYNLYIVKIIPRYPTIHKNVLNLIDHFSYDIQELNKIVEFRN